MNVDFTEVENALAERIKSDAIEIARLQALASKLQRENEELRNEQAETTNTND